MNIDVRARRAAADLHAAVALRREDRPADLRSPRSRRRLLAIASLGILLAGIVVVRTAVDRDHASRVSSTPVALPLLLPTWLPDGVVPVSIGDPRREPDDDAPGDVWYLGSQFGPQMVLQTTPVAGRFSPQDRDAVDIAGEPGAYVTLAVAGRAAQAVVWNKNSALYSLTTFSSSRSELLKVAAAIQQTVVPLEDAELPDLVRVLEHDPGARWLASGIGGTGRSVGWSIPAGRGEFVAVNVRRVSADNRVARSFWGGTVSLVRGHEAWFVPQVDREQLRVVTWLESPGIAVTVSSNYLDQPTIQRVAESLITASLDDWESVASEVRGGTPPPNLRGADFDVLVSGRTPAGTTWEIARRRVSPFLYCLLVDHQGDTFTGTVSCSGRTGDRTVFADRSTRANGRGGDAIQLVYGMVDAGVARVVVVTTDSTVDATLGETRDGFRAFAAPVVLSTVRVRSFDATGRELGDVPSVEPGSR